MVALAVLAVTSCTKETEVKVLEAGKQIEFNAVWADSDATRTVLQSDGTSVWWTPGEEINAFYGNKFSGKFTSTNTSNQALASFQGTLTVMTGTAEAGNEASSYWAVYPYDAFRKLGNIVDELYKLVGSRVQFPLGFVVYWKNDSSDCLAVFVENLEVFFGEADFFEHENHDDDSEPRTF